MAARKRVAHLLGVKVDVDLDARAEEEIEM